LTGCANVEIERNFRVGDVWFGGRGSRVAYLESNLTAVDPITFEIKETKHLPYPNYSGTLTTGGGLVFLALFDGTVAAFDDTTLEELWRTNVGSGFTAQPMTFEVNGRQYVGIASGASPVTTRTLREWNPPDLREMRQATILWVFGL
jgi:alcohol dehydrogenase (cytochrome c)